MSFSSLSVRSISSLLIGTSASGRCHWTSGSYHFCVFRQPLNCKLLADLCPCFHQSPTKLCPYLISFACCIVPEFGRSPSKLYPIFCRLHTKLCPNFGRSRARLCLIYFAPCLFPNLAGTLIVQYGYLGSELYWINNYCNISCIRQSRCSCLVCNEGVHIWKKESSCKPCDSLVIQSVAAPRRHTVVVSGLRRSVHHLPSPRRRNLRSKLSNRVEGDNIRIWRIGNKTYFYTMSLTKRVEVVQHNLFCMSTLLMHVNNIKHNWPIIVHTIFIRLQG